LLETLSPSFAAGSVASADDFVKAIERITMVDRVFSVDEPKLIQRAGLDPQLSPTSTPPSERSTASFLRLDQSLH
jgi:hypothetical protein